jgi:dTDP-4-amino-4,6-dideoxygalactose transaminase
MAERIPFFGINRQYQNLKDELLDVTDQVYSSGQVLDGNYTEKFEREIAQRCRRKFAVAVGSGTQGLWFATKALTDSLNSHILLPTLSFPASLNAVLQNNNFIDFCDVDQHGLIDLDTYSGRMDHTTDIVMLVNLFGNTVDYDRFRMHTEFFNQDIEVIEDAAQSFGASYNTIPSGKMGAVSVLSFDPTKNFNNYGSGGMVLTDDENLAYHVLNLRDNGKASDHNYWGTNSKMSEVDCAQMLVKLQHFDSWQKRRTDIANFWIENMPDEVELPAPSTNLTEHAWSKFVLSVDNRFNLMEYLWKYNIDTKVHYTQGLYDLPMGLSVSNNHFLSTERFTKRCVSLPIYPELSDIEVERIVDTIYEFYRGERGSFVTSPTQN